MSGGEEGNVTTCSHFRFDGMLTLEDILKVLWKRCSGKSSSSVEMLGFACLALNGVLLGSGF